MALGIVTVVAIVAIITIRTIAVTSIASIAVSISIASVLAVLTIAIVVAVLLLRHVDTIEDDAGIGQLAFAAEAVDNTHVGLRCVVGTTYIAASVGNLRDLTSS